MNEQQAAKQASRASKTMGTQYVVWVFDQGRDVFDQKQYETWKPFCFVEAVFVDGVKIADSSAVEA